MNDKVNEILEVPDEVKDFIDIMVNQNEMKLISIMNYLQSHSL